MTAKRTIKIPELEELIVPSNRYSEEEELIIRQYYNRVPARRLLEYLNKKFGTNRSLASIRKKGNEVCKYDLSRTETSDTED